ncbi:MAG: hypothetical protein A4E35_00976 [Methanoregula sp. PtaU1.Bin051]|nr:MAG: hypothetical protein A4E35_00976 [Methanoregula sp. PtaU1.Bin051]
MTTPHTLPVPPEIISRACDLVDRKVRRLPFVRRGFEVNSALVGAAMEELNAEASRTLAIRQRTGRDGRVVVDGLDRRLAVRGSGSPDIAEVIAGILTEAGIAERASVADRRSHRFIRAVRLSTAWTWTVASERAAPSLPVLGRTDGKAPAWTSLCPVCRAGRLGPGSAGRLFGVHETEYFICNSCGARFVPDSGKFRLVAIARKRDPLWERLLNRNLSGDEWQEIALHGHSDADLHKTRKPESRRKGQEKYGTVPAGEGRFAVEAGGSTLYFTALPVQFSRGSIRDLFAKRRETLRQILRHPAYAGIAGEAAEQYRHYLDLPAGPFLLGLKDRRNTGYQKFLNPHGDMTFCTFRTTASGTAEESGVFVVVKEGAVQAAGMSLRPFRETINDDLGNISPATCYRDGDSELCRINALMCGNRKGGGGLYVYAVGEEGEIRRILAEVEEAYGLPGTDVYGGAGQSA